MFEVFEGNELNFLWDFVITFRVTAQFPNFFWKIFNDRLDIFFVFASVQKDTFKSLALDLQ